MVAGYLPDSLHVLALVYTESFNRNSLAIVNAFPNIAETPMGNWVLSRLYVFIGDDMGIGEQPRSTT